MHYNNICSYRALKLDNGVRVLLVSEPSPASSSSALESSESELEESSDGDSSNGEMALAEEDDSEESDQCSGTSDTDNVHYDDMIKSKNTKVFATVSNTARLAVGV